jgi:hypothetical protein
MVTPEWPRGPVSWTEGRTLKISIPFTWNLPAVRRRVAQVSLLHDRVIVGGPALNLMPDFFVGLGHVCVSHDEPNVLQRINPQASRTTLGCIRKCKFCGIGSGLIEAGGLRELEDWPDKPILCDNNILAASEGHLERVVSRLHAHGWADFNQGLDVRLLNEDKAHLIASIGRPVCRLACDSKAEFDHWATAVERLRSAGVIKSLIKSLVLIGFDSDPSEAWERCQMVERFGIPPSPMWFHPLDSLEWNAVTEQQKRLGWSQKERTRIMGYFYKRRGTAPTALAA